MYEQTERPKENKSRSTLNSIPQRKISCEPTLQFVGKRKSIIQRITYSEYEHNIGEKTANVNKWEQYVLELNNTTKLKQAVAKYAHNKTMSQVRDEIKFIDLISPDYTEWQLEEMSKVLKEQGRENELPDWQKLGKIKKLSFGEINSMLIKNSEIANRGYPSPFVDMAEWQMFKDKIKAMVGRTGLPYKHIVLQGSALRKENPNDLDIGVILTDEQYQIYLLMDNLVSDVVLQSPSQEKEDANRFASGRKTNMVKKEKKGKVESQFFPNGGRLKDELTVLDQELAMSGKVLKNTQISIILENSDMDMKPNMIIS